MGPFRSGMEPLRSGMEPLRSGMEPLRSGMEPLRSGMEPLRSGMDPLMSEMDLLKPGMISSDMKSLSGIKSTLSDMAYGHLKSSVYLSDFQYQYSFLTPGLKTSQRPKLSPSLEVVWIEEEQILQLNIDQTKFRSCPP